MALPLSLINEFDALPRFDSLPGLLGSDMPMGQCELIAGSTLPASALHAGSVDDKGGNPIPEWWEPDPPIVCNAVQLFRVRDAFYAPGFGAVIASDGGLMEHTVVQARVQNPDLSALPYATREGQQVIFRPPDATPHLPAAVVSMPWAAIYNYGHFVCDCLTSLALLSQRPETGAYPSVFPPLSPWHRRHLELLGVTPIELDQPLYRIADVLFTNGIAQFINAPNINYRNLRDIQLRNKGAADHSRSKIYITRSRVTQTQPFKRRFLSEAALEERLRTLGFAIVTPELLDVDEQIDLFRNAEMIVSCRGAALANVIYCRRDATIVEIVPTIAGFEDYRWIRDICAIVGCRWRPYFCAGVPPESPVVVHGKKRPNAAFTFDVDVCDLIEFIARLTLTGQTKRA
jgi:capsular polysaccharide biosynthesis protein